MEISCEDFQREKRRIEKLSAAEQKMYYSRWLETHTEKTTVRVDVMLSYAQILYREGAFRQVMEALMPVVMNHEAYPYSENIITCFNQMGLAVNCESEYTMARRFFQMALEIAKEHQVTSVYAKQHNNIGLTYYDQNMLKAAVKEYTLAEEWISESAIKNIIGPMVYGNWTNVLIQQQKWSEALKMYQKGLDFQTDDSEDVENQVLEMLIYYHLGMQEEYRKAREKFCAEIKEQPAHMQAFYYWRILSLNKDTEDKAIVSAGYQTLEEFLKHPDANINWQGRIHYVQLLYEKAEKEKNTAAMLDVLKLQTAIQQEAMDMAEKKRLDALNEYINISAEKQKALEQAETATRAKTQFLSNMSHDIRTPMNAIFGLTQLMEHDRDNPEKMEDHIGKLRSSSRHLLSLINDVLDMSKIESAEVTLNREAINLADQVAQLRSIIYPQTEERKQRFHVTVQHILHENLLGDAVRLRQILINLLSNAVKYTPNGGDITLALTEKYEGEETYTTFEFSVTDTGYGMSEDFIKRIFEPFTRAENSTTNKIQGTGLGMAITKNIVDLMGGTISLKSELGKGSCFTVTLPLEIDTDAVPFDSSGQEQTADTGLKGMHFLCAEDNTLNAEILEAILEMEGAFCTILPDGKQIVERFESVKPGEYDAILMDMQMPVMNGLDATRAIRHGKNPLGETIPIIAMTANAFSSDIQDCLNVGMDAHLPKPLDVKALSQTVHMVIGGGQKTVHHKKIKQASGSTFWWNQN